MKRVSALIIIGLLCLSTFSIFAPNVKATGSLVGYWKFDEGSGNIAHDSSGNGNDGALISGPQWVTGVYGNALRFDGLGSYVNIVDSPSLRVSGNQVSAELWFKPTVTLDNNTAPLNILDKGNEYSFIMNHAHLPPVNGEIVFVIALGNPPQWYWIGTTTNHWTAGSWYHIAGTYDGSYLKVYVNGVLENSVALSGDLHTETFPLVAGGSTWGSARPWLFFSGTIDEVKVYNCARTAEEIWSDYNAVNRALIVNPKWQDVPSAYYPTVSTALEELGILYDILNPETLTLDILRNYDFVFIPSLGPYIPPEDLAIYNPDVFADIVEQYVIEGGSLMFCPGHSIVYGEHAREPPIFDIEFVENHRIVDFKVTDDTHPIMQGPYRAFSLGERIYAHEIDLQTFPADARILGVFVDTASGTEHGPGLAVFKRGTGKVATSGLQIGWTSSGPAVYNGVPAEEWIKLTKNTITWLIQHAPQVDGVETVVTFDGYDCLEPSFSVQQNFWIVGKGTVTKLYWAQNVVWVFPKLLLMIGIFEIWDYNTYPVTKPVAWREHVGFGLAKDTVVMRSTLEDDKLVMANDFSSISWPIPSDIVDNYHISVSHELPGVPRTPYGYCPEIILAGSLSLDIFGWRVIAGATFLTGTQGHVDTYLRLSQLGWVQGVNKVIDSPGESATEEYSLCLDWEPIGDFEFGFVADQGLKFTPDYDGEIVIPPPVAAPAGVSTDVMTIQAACPINLSLCDSAGRHIGYNPTTGDMDYEIPWALYYFSEDFEVIVIMNPSEEYHLSIIGTGDGFFELQILWEDQSGVISTLWEYSDFISIGETFEHTIVTTDEPFVIGWEHVFEDARRGTMLKISTDDQYFQFVAPDKDFGVKHDPNMKTLCRVIIIRYEDSEMRLIATAIDDDFDFCSAVAWDKQTRKCYLLIDKPNWQFWRYCRCWIE